MAAQIKLTELVRQRLRLGQSGQKIRCLLQPLRQRLQPLATQAFEQARPLGASEQPEGDA